MRPAILALAVLAAASAWPAAVHGDQLARSGTPLEVYCNTAPEFGTTRSDAVDNWVRICSIWLDSKCKASTPSLEDLEARREDRKDRT